MSARAKSPERASAKKRTKSPTPSKSNDKSRTKSPTPSKDKDKKRAKSPTPGKDAGKKSKSPKPKTPAKSPKTKPAKASASTSSLKQSKSKSDTTEAGSKSTSALKKKDPSLTRAEKIRLARERKEQEEEEKKQAEEEEKNRKREEAKARKEKAKAADNPKREEIDGKYFCEECGELIVIGAWDEHVVVHPAMIRDRLWLGDENAAKDTLFFKKYNVTHVLNCTKEIACPKEIKACLTGFKRIGISDKTSDSIMEYAAEAMLWCEEALAKKDNVLLVHCREGKSRSVSFLSCFLMWKMQISFESAFGMIKGRRPIAMPNPKFLKQLEEISKELDADRARPEKEKKYPVPKYKYKLKPPSKPPL